VAAGPRERSCSSCQPASTWTCNLTGYRSIPTIGWLFLVQFLVAFILAIGALVNAQQAGCRRRVPRSRCPPWAVIYWRSGSGLFGYKEIRNEGGGSPLA